MPDILGRLDQYASIIAYEFDDYSMSENLLTNSNISSSNWTINNSAVLTNNSSTSPDGIVNASQIAAPATAGSGVFRTFSLTSATVYTYSVFVKAVSGSNTIYFGTDTTTTALVTVNTSTGVASLNSGSPTNITSVSYPNSWYRVSFTFTASATATHSFVIYNLTASANTWLAYGAQVERGSSATDYTPTTSTAISRVLPATTNTNITGLGTYYSSGFSENVGAATTLTANVFPPYDLVYDDFGGTLFGPGQGRYMRQNTDKSVVIYNEINEMDLFVTDISTSGLQLYIDAGISTSVTQIAAVSQELYTTPGTYTFVVPAGYTSISAVCVGGGGGGGNDTNPDEAGSGGGGGGLAYQASIAVTPGESLTVVVGSGGGSNTAGGQSRIHRSGTNLVAANGGGAGQSPDNGNAGGTGGTVVVGTGGVGGAGGVTADGNTQGAGGGGAGGYSGTGGTGQDGDLTPASTAGAGGGGGGGGQNAGGGGVGILGTTGVDGTAGGDEIGGGAGSGGTAGSNSGVSFGSGGAYGGGGAGAAGGDTPGSGANGAVRIIYGSGRSYPSTNVTDQSVPASFTLADLSGNGRTGITTNGPTYSSIIREGSVVFDGTNDYMTHSAYKGITGTGARTAIIWFRASVPNIAYRLFGWGTTAAGGKWNISLDATTFRPRVEIATGSVLANTSAPNVTNGAWYMIAASAPASGTASNIKLYIDGYLITDTTVTSGATAINTISGSDVSFGASLADVAPGYLNGNVAQFLIYNRQLTDLEVLQVYKIISNRFWL